MGEAAPRSGSMPMFHAGRAHRHVSRMKDLHGLSLNLVIADSVGDDEHLSADMAVPGVVNARFENDVMDSGATCRIGRIKSVGKMYRAVESGKCYGLTRGRENHSVVTRSVGVFFKYRIVVIMVRQSVVFVDFGVGLP